MKHSHEDNLAAAVTGPRADRDGFAMVTALLVVLVLSVMAVGATWLATSEKKTTTAESQHMRSVFAADAGGEAGINFIRTADEPPIVQDMGGTNRVHSQGETALEGAQAYNFDVSFVRRNVKPGWEAGYYDYDYDIGAIGEAGAQGQTGVAVVASRLFKRGY